MKKIAYVGLGSNVENSDAELASAKKAIEDMPGVSVKSVSRIYFTEPQGLRNQPWFHNQVLGLELEENWGAETFLKALLELETALGRVRGPDPAFRFGPRKIDLDLLLFDNEVIHTADCEVPHPRLCERAFALVPLREIAPEVKIYGSPLGHWLNLIRWEQKDNTIWQA